MASVDQKESLRKELLELNAKRSKIESELKSWNGVLGSQNMGMKEELVDREGYPRADIDVYQVRTARNKIITLTNDARQVMREIEEKLHEFHALTATDTAPPSR